MRCHSRKNSALLFVKGACIFVNGTYISVNAAFVYFIRYLDFVNGAYNIVNAASRVVFINAAPIFYNLWLFFPK